ncbi:helix-turn-helix domain-containing protein [Lacticaseibacillus jixianensis]|uniref:Helix-turn-helix domain-containing protein n=1 Tax=Lacticaseibacillus jixianensis TaxID=2486012 RepID=A0ABW4B7X2_9LACO|nr:helix-turn-helix domain-containing protein [Lacticaseibacillus jixianensis]
MDFETIFLEKADLQKFTMFHTLVTNQAQSLSITDLAERLALSYQQSYNVFQELTRDLVDLSGKTAAQVKQALTGGALLPQTIDDYRVFLLNESISFQFIDYLVQGSQQTVSSFCTSHFISRSTLMRKTATVRSFLAGYHIRLSLTQAAFIGDEKQIRLFLQQFYWLSYHGSQWPFRALDFQILSQQYQQLPTPASDPIVASQERLFWGLCRTRMSRGHFVKLPLAFARSFPHSPFRLKAIYPSKRHANVPQATLDAEGAFFYFFQQKMITFAQPSATTLTLVDQLEAQNSPIIQVVAGLPQVMHSQLVAPATQNPFEDPLLYVNLVRVAAAFYLMDGDFVKQTDFFKPALLNYQQQQVRRLLSQYIADLPDEPGLRAFKRAQNALVEMFFYLLVPYMQEFNWEDMVKVKLVMETTDTINRNIIDFVRNLNVVDLLPDEAPLADADLLITALDDFVDPDMLTSLPPSIAKFNWYLDATDGDFRVLFQTIFSLFQRKLLAANQ